MLRKFQIARPIMLKRPDLRPKLVSKRLPARNNLALEYDAQRSCISFKPCHAGFERRNAMIRPGIVLFHKVRRFKVRSLSAICSMVVGQALAMLFWSFNADIFPV
jgi:hypothetical protein